MSNSQQISVHLKVILELFRTSFCNENEFSIFWLIVGIEILINQKANFKGVHHQKITIYPVIKNFGDAVDPEYFFSEKYIENARTKRKILFIRALT